jgi:hypothetical protein
MRTDGTTCICTRAAPQTPNGSRERLKAKPAVVGDCDRAAKRGCIIPLLHAHELPGGVSWMTRAGREALEPSSRAR